MNKVDLNQIERDAFFRILSKESGKKQDVVEKEWEQLIVLNEEVVNLVIQLKKDYSIGLCSNAATWEIRPILEMYKLDVLFDEMVISGEVKLVKPEESIFRYTLSALSINPENAIFIDDNKVNVEAARKIGIHSIVFENVEQLKRNLSLIC